MVIGWIGLGLHSNVRTWHVERRPRGHWLKVSSLDEANLDRQCSFTDARSLMYGVADVEVVPSSTAPLILDRGPF